MVGKKTDKDDESKKPDDSKSPQVNDVSKPGQTAASPTSRPIITPHASMIKQDPMVSGGSDEEVVQKKSESRINIKPELKLKPISDDKPAEEDEDKGENKSETEQKKEDDKPEPDENKTEAKTEDGESPEVKPDEDQGDDSAAIDSLASSAGSNKQTAQETEEEKKRVEKIKELSDSKKYYVPIVEGGHKASYERLLSWLILILLLAAVGVYLAIDAGYLNVGINLPYNFIGN